MEIWKDVPGYAGLYQVSNYGRIKSLSRKIVRNNKSVNIGNIIMSQSISNKYYSVMLYKDNTKKRYLVHRLVAAAFIPNQENFSQVNHKDENKLNNHVDNLEWYTSKYNNNYKNKVEKCASKHRKSINQYDKKGNFINSFNSGLEASILTGINVTSISLCRKGKLKTAGGFIWEGGVK